MKTRSSRTAPLKGLQAFCVAAELGSFKAAAERLCLTPSAVSHQMKELELALGVRLFERRTRALSLTGPGQVLAAELAPLLAAVDDCVARVARRQRRAVLRLHLPPFFASELFMPAMASFCATHPAIDIHVDSHEARPVMHPPGADISILLTGTPPDGLHAAPLFAFSLVAACARQHAATVARLGARVFDALPLIVHKSLPYAWSDWARQLGLEAPESRHFVELDSMYAVVRAAERGVGIALVPETPAAAWFDAGTLVRVFDVPLTTPDRYFVVARPEDAARPEVAAMLAWIMSSSLRAPVANERRSSQEDVSLTQAS